MEPKLTRAEKAAARRAADPEKARAISRAHYARNREKRLASQAAWKARNSEEVRAKSGLVRLRQYGLTPAMYEVLYDSSGGRCAICSDTFTRVPDIDHCHTTGEVRGLLCSHCNTGLGKFRDSTERLQAAIRYLEKAQCSTTDSAPKCGAKTA